MTRLGGTGEMGAQESGVRFYGKKITQDSKDVPVRAMTGMIPSRL